MRSRAVTAAILGVAGGTIEVALRLRPRQGLDAGDVAAWLCVSVLLACAASAAAMAIGARTRRPLGVALGLLLGGHAAINYRFEVVLNEFVRDPRVWGGMLACFAGGLGAGIAMNRIPRAALGAAAAIAVVVAFARTDSAAGPPASKPNILVITLDTVRPDRLSPYGREIETPNLQRLADEGVVFEQAVAAAPITEPSHLSMFTGLTPLATGVVANGTKLGDRPLVWRALREVGYRTAGFVAGFPLHSRYGWDQGFDVYDDDFGAIAGVQALSLVKAWNQVAVKEHALRERTADRVLARAVPWIRAHRDEQVFAWVHLYDPHGPYVSPYNADLGPAPTNGSPVTTPEYWPAEARAITSAAWLAAAYEAELRWVDDAVGALLDALGPTLDRTVLVVIADHGESLGEHDYWFDHGDDLYDPSLRVPWILRYPPAARIGRVPCQVGGIDLAPTLLELAGVPDPATREGISRVPELGGQPCRERPVFASTTAGRFVDTPPVDHALRTAGEKLVRHQEGTVELYDLVVDPRELTNLAPGPRSDTLRAVLERRVAGANQVRPENDAETQEGLKALGYLD